ncbi:MAG: 2'-5' RNA ligase [Alphaproteobacteria bacterium GWF2_58_20]|nr:MAG: 2'-5' RNA ligase [Alphaproteobacteria bacterium GWF2_58_20]
MPERLARMRDYNLPGAAWEMRENLHLTLRFIGDVDEGMADDLDAVLGRVQSPGFTLTLKGTGAFGGENPRVLWAGVAESAGLRELQKKLDAACLPLCGPDSHARFMPHITLARLEGTSPQMVADYLERTSRFEEQPFGVRSFTLFTTRDGGKRKWYEPLRDYHFAQNPEML